MSKIAVINSSFKGMKPADRIYNLAVDKIAHYYRLRGDQVYAGEWESFISEFASSQGHADKYFFSVIFTWDIPGMIQAVNQVRSWGKPVEIGGPAATFMPQYIEKMTGIKPHTGLNYKYETIAGDFQLTFTSRGCPHGCRFCLPYGTKVLMADSIWKNIEDIKVGEELVGVIREGRYYRYSSSTVLETFERQAEVFVIQTEGGVAHSTEEHPWMMAKGAWKSIADLGGRFATRAVLRKVSPPLAQPLVETTDYKMGYLVGCHRGDGYMGFHQDKRRPHGGGSLRTQLVGDNEMLDRFLTYARDLELPFHERPFNGGIFKRCTRAVVCETNRGVEKFWEMVDSQYALEGDEFIRGFLAGIFDAEGSFSQTVLRIANKDNSLKLKVSNYLTKFNFSAKIEEDAVRLLGGLSEQIRFLALVQPSVKRKCSFFGTAVKNASPRILGVRSEGIKSVRNLRTTTENFVADGFITHNCGVRRVEPDALEYEQYPIAPMVGDNNITATSWEHQKHFVSTYNKHGFGVNGGTRVVDINSGFDVRFFQEDHYALYSTLKIKTWRFAFDTMNVWDDVWRVATMMKHHGLDRHEVTFYCLMGFPGTAPDECRFRMDSLISLGMAPYPMRFIPLNSLSHKYVAPGWNEDLLTKMQTYYQSPFTWMSASYDEFKPGKNKQIARNKRIEGGNEKLL